MLYTCVLFFPSLYGGQFTLSTPLINQFFFILLHCYLNVVFIRTCTGNDEELEECLVEDDNIETAHGAAAGCLAPASSICSSPGRSKAVLDNHDSFTSHALVELNSVLRPSTWAKIQSHQVEDELLLDRLEEIENREAPSVPVKRRVSGQKPDGNRYVT